MAYLYDLARMTTATTGTGTITLGSAVASFLSFANAGVSDGETITYAIKDGSNSEIGRGVYTASGTTLTRSVLRSTNSNNAINLSGSAEVFISPSQVDLLPGSKGGYGLGLVNGTLSASAATNALTIAVKTLDGADPSSTSPVVVFFRSATATSGLYVRREITSALSVTIPASQAVGTSNSVPFRINVEAIDNAGTVELAVINCVSGGSSPTAVRALPADGVVSTTAIASAPSAGVFYSTTARTNLASRHLGYVEYSSGLATAGTWASAPTRINLFGPGIPLPGQIVQTVYVKKTDTFTSTSTTLTDITGLSTSISPTSAANPIMASFSVNGAGTAATNSLFLVALRGSTAIAVGDAASSRSQVSISIAGEDANTSIVRPVAWSVMDAPGTTSSTTYKVQGRCNAAGTFYINRTQSDGDLASTPRVMSGIKIDEIMS